MDCHQLTALKKKKSSKAIKRKKKNIIPKTNERIFQK